MINLENVAPEILDQGIRRLLATERSPEREVAIAMHLAQSAELHEWVTMILSVLRTTPYPWICIYSAVAFGLEVGYELGSREVKRMDRMRKEA